MALGKYPTVIRVSLAILLLICCIVMGVPPSNAPGQPAQSATLNRVYFVPIGAFASPSLSELATHYREKFGLVIEILPEIPFERGVVNYRREQVIGEEMIELMKRRYSELVTDPTVMLIGVTTNDMYIRDYTWRFAFGIRNEGRLVVVSSYRMDPTRFGLVPDQDLLKIRLRKIITKNIGILYYKLPQSNDPRSVLYGKIMGLEELDMIGEDWDGAKSR